jgi:hypothetical protein
VLAAGALLLHGPLPQPQGYHDLADARTLLGVPRAMDVLSNAGFLLVGALVLREAARGRGRVPAFQPWRTRALVAFGGGLVLTAIGSAAHHLDPRDATLVWDRLPMAIVFAAFVSLVVGERLGAKAGTRSLLGLALLGLGSVGHWAWTLSGSTGGDLRLYAFVKYVPAALAVLVLLFVPEPRSTRRWPLLLLGAFGVATAFELLDAPIWRATGGLVAGHTLKHLAAAAAAALVLPWQRSPVYGALGSKS